MSYILKSENLTKSYGKENILNGVSLSLQEKTFTVILGHSGSGKSTLINILSGLVRPTCGTVQYEEDMITSYSEKQLAKWKRNEVSNVFQNYLLLNNLNIEENIRIGISKDKTPLSFDRITRILGIDDLLNKFPSELSGGEQQRVAIARAVIKSPRILFCDEITGSLDEDNSKNVVELLHELKSTFGMTILFTTHNQQIAKTADRIITIKNGLISEDRINENPIFAKDMDWG